jgi:hypothetical protein
MTANFGTATGTDNCGSVTISNFSRTLTGTNCIGEIRSWWRATDECGIQNECYQTITVLDKVAPTIICPPNLTISCNANSTPANTGTATATDSCTGNISVRYTDAFTTQGCSQNLIRTWTANDGCGNIASCTQTITLTDNIAPNIMCPPDLTLSCGANTNPSQTGNATATDACQNGTTIIYVDSIFGNNCDKTITRTWTVTDSCGNKASCVQLIRFVDKTPPTFICGSNLTPLECTQNTSNIGISNVMDNCGGKISQTKVDVVSVNGCLTTIIRTWTVTDQCGNSATCAQEIRMQDTKPPVLSGCGRKITVQGVRNTAGLCQATVNITSPTATDMCDSSVVLSNSFNNTSNASGTYPLGQTIITWTAKDDCGLMVMCRDTVVVMACSDCCYNRTAFDSIVSTSISITRNGCEISVIKTGLTPCQRLKFIWGDGQTSAYFAGSVIVSTHDYGTSGDYLLCAVIEELAADSSVCFRDTICRDVCVTCGDGCTDDRIVYECHDFTGLTSTEASIHLTRFDLIKHNGLLYAANSKIITVGNTDATITLINENTCNKDTVLTFGGTGIDLANSIKINNLGTKIIVSGTFTSPFITIPANQTSGNSQITLTNPNIGSSNSFLMAIDIITLKIDWAFSLGYIWNDFIADIAIDANDSIYIVGSVRGQGNGLFVNFAPLGISSSSNFLSGLYSTDVATGFVAKYDPNGKLVWYDVIQPYGINNLLDGNANIGCNAIDIDGINIYVGGSFQAGIPYVNDTSAITLGTGQTILIPIDTFDGNKLKGWSNFVIKYDLNGTPLMSQELFSGLGDNHAPTQLLKSLKINSTDVFVGGTNLVGRLDKSTLGNLLLYNTDIEINDMEVEANMIYIIGSNRLANPNLDFVTASQPYTASNWGIPVGIYDSDLNHKKSMFLGGSRFDRGNGIEVDTSDFYIQGITSSLDFIYNPDIPNYISASPNLPEYSIFIGKYSCACEPDTDCCEDVSASFSGQDTCCKTLNLINNAGFDICKVSVELTTPGWVVNTSTTASGYIFTSILNGLEITHPSGIIPAGSLSNLAQFCLSGNPGLSPTQQFVVHYYENTTSENKLLACTDTLIMACDPPPPPDSCFVTNIISVNCEPSNPYVYNVSFTVTNLSSNITATSILLSGLPQGYNFISCAGGTATSSILVPIFPNVSPGATSLPLCIQIYSANSILNPTDICFDIKLEGLNGLYYACCTDGEKQCVTLLPCCQPCEDLKVNIQPSAIGGKDRCCYNLSLNNSCSYQYFTKMDVSILTPNVHYGNISSDPNWTNCTPPTLQNLCLTPNAGTVGSGSFQNVIQFCLANITSLAQVPQQINIKFYTAGTNGLDSLACDTIMVLQCNNLNTKDSCLIVTNSVAYCDPETGKYNVSMTITNNSNPSFCADQVLINPQQSGASISQSVILLGTPLCFGQSTTINFTLTTNPFPDSDGLIPLIISMKNLNGVCCQGGLAYIDTLILPECPCATICCASGNPHDFENLPLGNLPNNQVGWANNQGNPQVVAGGANGSGKSISLHAGSRGVRPASVSYGTSGVVGPDTIFEANKQYCISFWARLLPSFNLNGKLGIYADGLLIQTIIIPPSNTVWTQYSFNFIAPTPGQEILIFTNESPSPNDAGPGILIDQVCFDEIIQVFDDMTSPILSCPMDLSLQDTDLDCSVPHVIPNISITDPSGVGLVQCYLDGTLVPIGSSHNLTNALVHTIKFVAEDVCGNRDSCSYKITVKCLATCLCPSNPSFTLKEGNKAPVSVFCNQPLSTIPVLDCPVDPVTISGNFGCVSSIPNSVCPPNTINWALVRPSGNNLSGSITGPNINLTFLSTSIKSPGMYSLSLITVCGTDTCKCEIKWIQKDCADCKCPGNAIFTLKEGSKNPVPISCNQSPTAIPVLDCPIDSVSISGNFGCMPSDPNKPCPPNSISWTLVSPTLSTQTGTATGPNFGVNFTANAVTAPGTYSLTLVTICNGDTCRCVIKWVQRPCQTCTCVNNPSFTIKEGSKNPVSISCNPPQNAIPVLVCPVDPLTISGYFGCESSDTSKLCKANDISWKLDRPTLPSLTGIVPGPNFGFSFFASSISIAGTYTLNLFTVCDGDTCHCVIKWIQEPCPPNCTCPANNNTITLTKGQQTFNLNCGSIMSALPKLNCPISPVLITGNFGCISSDTSKNCDPNLITYRLDRPGMPAITGFNIGPNLNIILNAPDISAPGIYVLHLATVCPGSQDTCRCQIKWEQEDCSCCKDFRAFVVNTQNAVLPSIDPMTCKTTLNIANLHPCIKIDTIKWGDNMFTAGVLPTGQMYMHTYASSGNYTIEITFSEYDSNGKKCWSNKVYTSINLMCSNVSCICNYKRFTIEGTPVDCNNAPALISCPNKKVVTITAQMGCLPAGCSSNITQYVIKDASNITVTSGTLSGTTLQLLSGWFDPLGGLYSIEFTTLCGSSVCKCKLNFIVPACPKKCLCDKDFEAEIGLGFSTYHYPIPICKKRFTPRNLCPKDKVIWTLNGISQDTSSGLDPVIFNILPSNSTVCMIMERMESPNNLCRDTICQFYNSCRSKSTPSILCNYPKNPTFDGSIEGKLNDGGMIPDWKLISGKGFVFTEEGIDFENVKLKASKNSPADLYQNCCLDGPLGKNVTISKMTFDIQNFGFEKLLPGSKMKIFSAPSDVTVTDVDLIGEIDISNISFGWEQRTISFPATLWKFNNLVIRFENPSLEEASIRIDNLCMDFVNSTFDDTFKNDFTLYPNPTTGHMTIQFASDTEQDYTLKVLDILGREVNSGIIDKGSSNFNFSIDDMAGIYIIQVTDGKGNSSQRKVIKIE